MEIIYHLQSYITFKIKDFFQTNINISQFQLHTLENKIRRNRIYQLHQISRNIEIQILEHSGNDLKNLSVQDVTIGEYLNEHQWVHTVKYSKDGKNKPKILLIHGFAGSVLSYHKMFSLLSEKYEVYAIDLPGMGLSSKPLWQFKAYEETINYFTKALEQWRQEVKIEKLILVGHSLGGYIGSHYAIQYPDKVEKIVLLSPVGVTLWGLYLCTLKVFLTPLFADVFLVLNLVDKVPFLYLVLNILGQ
ncbi:hypothetical protein IMG5_178630 [Ichthyophthirius multifiliis]|uniref:AB hydrolase-1 domain-containing protein n=1 Tax=Ichthyophthirius multifiliis TaxID=5932 RepID=G0R2I9_ICHMU|nr:hypothetical protein IMG5_178630 [Ichthyophthirius multifiliis]EGR28315.1 hypothetical protein IMG5_178630 [Ichthyophthirius multifiliis]|eukprot:XP_004027660.1 hypothetical protein IMG5_178630 [Ichthyophthirius multifiliis]